MTLKSELIAAKALIATPETWCRGTFQTSTGYCAAGACLAVSKDRLSVWSKAEDFLSDFLPKGFRSVPRFNDHPNTTHTDIMALFDRAIEKAGM